MWYLSSLTRDRTSTPCIRRQNLPTRPPGKYLYILSLLNGHNQSCIHTTGVKWEPSMAPSLQQHRTYSNMVDRYCTLGALEIYRKKVILMSPWLEGWNRGWNIRMLQCIGQVSPNEQLSSVPYSIQTFGWAFMLMTNLDYPGPRGWLHFTYKFIQSFLLLFSFVMFLTHMEFSRNTTTM